MTEKLKNNYLRNVPRTEIDVYDVLLAFNVTCPARQHAIKKLLCSGLRGGGKDASRDIREAIQALERALQIEEDAAAYVKSVPGAMWPTTVSVEGTKSNGFGGGTAGGGGGGVALTGGARNGA